MTHNPAKFRFPTLKNQGAKARGQNVTVFDGTSTYRNVLFSFVETLFVACFVTTGFQGNELMNFLGVLVPLYL